MAKRKKHAPSRGQLKPNMTVPERFGRLVDKVMDRDREYFEQHPGETEYLRPYVPGELHPLEFKDATDVLVTQISPGIRTRQPVMWVPGLNSTVFEIGGGK
jgi:hypothetical protein